MFFAFVVTLQHPLPPFPIPLSLSVGRTSSRKCGKNSLRRGVWRMQHFVAQADIKAANLRLK